MHVDLAVVGASFAGLATAHAAASRGVRAVVLERKADVGDSPRTTGILVKEVADIWDVPRWLTRKIHAVRLYSPSMRHVDLERPGYFFLATDMPGLMRWWADQARHAGAMIRTNSPFRSAARLSDGRIQLDTADITCRFLVGADGASSRVARSFGLGCNRRWLSGCEIELRGVSAIDADHLHVFLDSSHAPGYIGWAVPGVDGITQVGLAATRGRRLDLDGFVAKLGCVFDFSNARVVARRAGKIPAGGLVTPMGQSNVLLIGDAAGAVSPLTAGGIHTAIELGRTAGIAISDRLFDDGPDPVMVMQRRSPRFRFKKLLRTAFDVAPPPDWMFDRAVSSPLFCAIARTVFYHHRGLRSYDAWRDIATAVAGAHRTGHAWNV
ncbi:MAG: NAD(P)/FAD-dependent oxidoreductase [Phycisphaerales bacterium]